MNFIYAALLVVLFCFSYDGRSADKNQSATIFDSKPSSAHEIARKFPTTHVKADEEWREEIYGRWKHLIYYENTESFSEISVELNSKSKFSELEVPINSTRAFHILKGKVGFRLKINGRWRKLVANEGDVLIPKWGIQVEVRNQEGMTRSVFDVTYSSVRSFRKFAGDRIQPYQFIKSADLKRVRFAVRTANGIGPEQEIKFLVSPDQVHGAFSRLEFLIGPDEKGPPPHTHSVFETFRLPEGEPSIDVFFKDDHGVVQHRELSAGDVINVSPGTVHKYQNPGKKPVRFWISTLSSKGLEKLFLDYAKAYSKYTRDELDRSEAKEKNIRIELLRFGKMSLLFLS